MAISRGGVSQAGGNEKNKGALGGSGRGRDSDGPNRDRETDLILGRNLPKSTTNQATVTRNKSVINPDKGSSIFSDRGYTDPYNTGKFGPTVSPDESSALTNMSPNAKADFNAARYGYDLRDTDGQLDSWDLLDFLAGPFVDTAQPTPLKPNTFENGTWHTYSNPGGILGLIGGGLTGVPGLGFLGSQAWKAADLPMVMHNSLFGTSSTPQTQATPTISPGMAKAPALKSLSPLNNRIGGYSGGGYAMGSFGKKNNNKKTKSTDYLSSALMAP